MLKTIDGFRFRDIMDYGARHLENNINVINDLNVFPVPDGDTGTNMVLTVKNGLASIKGLSNDLPLMTKNFGDAVVFGARGNSGVIFSQFLKGICDHLNNHHEVTPLIFCEAVDNGVKFAYSAVAQPVEGTILTVINEASKSINSSNISFESIDEVITVFLTNAKTALEKTTDMLPVLKKAGVIDSGGAGLVCFFEGIMKYLNGEKLDESNKNEAVPSYIDFSVYNRNSKFEFGYCTELLIQLQDCKEQLDIAAFKDVLNDLGDSLVISYDSDKLRVHIHTQKPEQILEYCHKYGEFLSLKIENMSVQHTQRTPKIIFANNKEDSSYATVCVAPNKRLAETFINMGADIVMLNESCPPTEDFIEAFSAVSKEKIIVFPNDPDSILAARQAAELYDKSCVTVIDCVAVTNCYSALAILDFDCDDINSVVETVKQTIESIYSVTVRCSARNLIYGEKTIDKNNYFASTGTEILDIGDTLHIVVMNTVNKTLEDSEYCVITLFYGQNTTEDEISELSDSIISKHPFVEVFSLPIHNVSDEITISFE